MCEELQDKTTLKADDKARGGGTSCKPGSEAGAGRSQIRTQSGQFKE